MQRTGLGPSAKLAKPCVREHGTSLEEKRVYWSRGFYWGLLIWSFTVFRFTEPLYQWGMPMSASNRKPTQLPYITDLYSQVTRKAGADSCGHRCACPSWLLSWMQSLSPSALNLSAKSSHVHQLADAPTSITSESEEEERVDQPSFSPFLKIRK